ncbi:MAG TPA: sugar transferase, partial [Armatimonadota bacterium]
MAFSSFRRIENWLLGADILWLMVWSVAALFFPVALQTTLAWVMGAAWFAGLLTVGGYNPAYLHPRYRILVSMALSLAFATLLGIFWMGSGHDWYLKGGIHYLIALGVVGTALRFVISFFFRHPVLHIVPFRLPAAYRSLLEELSRQPNIVVEALANDDPQSCMELYGRPGTLIVTDLRLREEGFNAVMALCEQAEIADICEVYESVLGKVAIIESSGEWQLPLALRVPSPIRETVKRMTDTLFVLITAPISLPIIALCALGVKLTSRGPAFLWQERLGRFGKPFLMLKLRTMVENAEELGPQWTRAQDPRVTPFGRFLRVTALDELPQFWNILCGEMSLIGPRPERPEIVENLRKSIPFFNARLLTYPGLTGWAQLHQGGDATTDDVVNKLRFDLYYLKHSSVTLDLRIWLGTMQMLLHLAKPAPKSRVEV